METEGKVVVIVGPTASGKSALAVRLARELGGEVISADSRQVYRGLNIGTGKVTKREMAGVRHHLLDVASPRRQFSVAEWIDRAGRAIADIRRRGRIPIVCGGTGFYIDALIGRTKISNVPSNPRLRERLAKKSPASLWAMLNKLDARRARTIDRHNPRRLIRAIEIAKTATKVRPFEARQSRTFSGQTLIMVGLMPEREKLRGEIHDRLLSRMKAGMAVEVRRLHARGLPWKRMGELGLEYRYLSRYVRGVMTRKEMLDKLETEIWRYAKRQITWFKRNPDIHWFPA